MVLSGWHAKLVAGGFQELVFEDALEVRASSVSCDDVRLIPSLGCSPRGQHCRLCAYIAPVVLMDASFVIRGSCNTRNHRRSPTADTPVASAHSVELCAGAWHAVDVESPMCATQAFVDLLQAVSAPDAISVDELISRYVRRSLLQACSRPVSPSRCRRVRKERKETCVTLQSVLVGVPSRAVKRTSDEHARGGGLGSLGGRLGEHVSDYIIMLLRMVCVPSQLLGLRHRRYNTLSAWQFF